MTNKEVFTQLLAPFDANQVKTRRIANRDLRYVTARTVMNRLDEVVGMDSWWDEYETLSSGDGVVCRLSVRLSDGRVITKVDAGGYAGMQDEGDDEKAGFSDAFKRAAVKFGVGRYLYGDGVPVLREAPAPAPAERFNRSGVIIDPPTPAPAPASAPAPAPASERKSKVQARSESGSFSERDPNTGKSLFTWIKHHEEQSGADGLLKQVNDFGKSKRYPARMVDWNAEQVAGGLEKAKAFLAKLPPKSPPVAEPDLTTVPLNGQGLVNWVNRSSGDVERFKAQIKAYGRRRRWPELVKEWHPTHVAEIWSEIQRMVEQDVKDKDKGLTTYARIDDGQLRKMESQMRSSFKEDWGSIARIICEIASERGFLEPLDGENLEGQKERVLTLLVYLSNQDRGNFFDLGDEAVNIHKKRRKEAASMASTT